MAINKGQFPIAGRLGYMVGQKMRNGWVLRKHMSPTNPQSELQQLFRNRLSSNVASWNALAEYQREMWREYAESISGPDFTYDGYTLYLSSQLRIINSAQNYLKTPPIGLVFSPFSLTGDPITVAQQAAGSPTVEVDFYYEVPTEIVAEGGSNFGGVVLEIGLIVGTRQAKYCPSYVIGGYGLAAAGSGTGNFTLLHSILIFFPVVIDSEFVELVKLDVLQV
jgi:hypothetical protein